MRINHNIAALNTHRQLGANQASSGKNLEKLSSGLKINRAGDDAAGLAISEKMRAQIRGLDMASKNAQDSISLIQTAEGAMNETHSILQRMRELAVQSSNDTNTTEDREKLQQEINQLTSEINRIGKTTQFNNKNLLNGDLAAGTSTIGGTGAEAATGISVTVPPTSTLEAGNYTIDITKTQTVTSTSAQVNLPSSNISGDAAKFVGDIEIGATNSFLEDAGTFAKVDVTFDEASNSFTVKMTGGVDESEDVIKADADGNFTYDMHGVKFTLAKDHGLADGESFTIDTDGALGTTITGNAEGWTSLPTTAAGDDPAELGDVTIDPAASEIGTWTGSLDVANNTLTMKFTNADGVETVSDVVALTAGVGSYDAHGISFAFDAKDSTGTGEFSFDVKGTYTLSAQLKDADGTNVGTAQTLATGYDGTATSGSITGTVGGVTLNQTGALDEGTISFEVTEDKTADGSLSFQIGSNQNQTMSLAIEDMQASALKIVGDGAGYSSKENVTDGTNNATVEKSLDITTAANAANAISVLDNAINTVSTERSKLGAVQNRLEHTINNLGTSSENLTAAESRIRDVDMAKEMMEFTKNNILSQAAQAMLAQANQQPQGVLQLLG